MRIDRLHRAMNEAGRNGGVPARRAVVRWAWRMFRREWRQQILVLTLLTLAVAGAVAGTTVAYNVVPPRDARFGTADHLIEYGGSDPKALHANIDAARQWFGLSMSSLTG